MRRGVALARPATQSNWYAIVHSTIENCRAKLIPDLAPLQTKKCNRRNIRTMNQSNPTTTTPTILVNGESHATKPGATVVDLLRELGLDHGRVAIERNLEILPRDQWQ